jgi:hypothetical protein
MYLFLICSGTGFEIKYRSPLSGAWKSNTDTKLVPPSELKGICQIDHSHSIWISARTTAVLTEVSPVSPVKQQEALDMTMWLKNVPSAHRQWMILAEMPGSVACLETCF